MIFKQYQVLVLRMITGEDRHINWVFLSKQGNRDSLIHDLEWFPWSDAGTREREREQEPSDVQGAVDE